MTTIQAYIDAQEEDRRPTLLALRKLVRETVPDAVESIRYGMPYYNHHGDLCAFAAQQRYYSFYVMSGGDRIAPEQKKALAKLDVGKGCIRWRRPEAVDLHLARELVHAVRRSPAAPC